MAERLTHAFGRIRSATAGLALGVAAASGCAVPAAAAPQEKLQIVTASGPHDFDVEVMRTEQDRARGLMFRKTMAQNHGMLFDFERSQPIYMWMKSTILPLDMVFIDSGGTVVNVAENTTPMSEKIIASGAPVLGVLEVNAGTAQAIGLKNGDKIINGMFRAK